MKGPNQRSTESVLSFGRYRGRALPTVPADYLCWLLDRPGLREPLRTQVLTELEQRVEDGRLAPEPTR